MKNRLIKDNVENSEVCNTKKKTKDQIVIDYVYKNIFNKNIFLNIFKRNNYNGIEKNKTITKKDTSNIDIEKRKEEIENYKKEKNDNEEYLLFLSYVYNDLISFIENDKEYHLKNSEFLDIEDLIIDICGNICHKSFNNIKKIFTKSLTDQDNVYNDMNDKCIDDEINENKNFNEPSFFFIPPMEFIVSHIYKLNSNLNNNYLCKEREDMQTFIKNNDYDKKCNILNDILNNEPPLKTKEDEIQNEFENETNKKKKNSMYIYLNRINDKFVSNSSQDEKSKFSLEKEIKINDHKINDSIFYYPYKEINESSDYTHDSDGYNSSSQDELISESINSLETLNEQISNKESRHDTSQNGINISHEQSENEILNVSNFKENKLISNISMNERSLYKENNESETNSKHVDNLNNYHSLKGYDSNSIFSKSFNVANAGNADNVDNGDDDDDNGDDDNGDDDNDDDDNGDDDNGGDDNGGDDNGDDDNGDDDNGDDDNGDDDKINIDHSIHKRNEPELPEDFIISYRYQESEHKDIDTYKCSNKEENKNGCQEERDPVYTNRDDDDDNDDNDGDDDNGDNGNDNNDNDNNDNDNNDNDNNDNENDNNSITNEEIKRVANIPNSINPTETQNVLGTYENNNIMTNIELAKINSNKMIKYTNYDDPQINNVGIDYEERDNTIKDNIIINSDDKIKMCEYDKQSFENKQLIIKHNEYYEKLNKMLINKKEKIYKEQKEYTKNNNLHDDYYYFKYVNTYEDNLNPYCYTKILKKANIQITRSPFPQFLRDIQIYNIPTKKIRLKKYTHTCIHLQMHIHVYKLTSLLMLQCEI
ncbi:hypothetical protein Py17XNL_000900421 [Plasmodium yoelii yoelii]|uniref:Uncharacterized protein n=2 Tax=Plasmodium yoelii yoelii TaxID=73239 RepID=A0AAE9WW54_PLAYO|nr:hypothetical protein Py17XNL_000900421 [Plasmodium yoelii yoelii]